MFDREVQEHLHLTLELQCRDHNKLVFVHHGKRFGEGGVYDSNQDGSLACSLRIIDIRFDGVSIDHLRSQLWFEAEWTESQKQNFSEDFINQYSKILSDGFMDFNGSITLDFSVPIYNWLIVSKYKVPMVELAYFSNYSARWHYERDLELIAEIKKLINDKDRGS